MDGQLVIGCRRGGQAMSCICQNTAAKASHLRGLRLAHESTQLFELNVGLLMAIKRSAEPPIPIHQIDAGGVVHHIASTRRRHFLGISSIGLNHRFDLLRFACQANDPRIERAKVVGDRLHGVALGVYRYENDRQSVSIRP